MKNNRPPILQSDWSIASRHGRNTIITIDCYEFPACASNMRI